MAGFNSFNPLNITKRPFRSQRPELPIHETTHSRDFDPEKHGQQEESDDDSDYSSYPSSPASSRDTSGSYSSSRPILRKPSTGGPPPRRPMSTSYRLPNRVVRYLCCALISTVIIFMITLVRMSIISSNKVQIGDLGERPPPPPAPWESFEFLTRYYGGIRTLLPASENQPQYPIDEPVLPDDESSEESPIPLRDVPTSKSFLAYDNHSSASYLAEYAPVQECFLDAASTVKIPNLQYYQGRPSGFPEHAMGSYDLLGLQEDICFDRYGRLGPYGFGYSLRSGGSGTGQTGDREGSDAVWKVNSGLNQVDFRNVDWADAQKRCFVANAGRFEKKSPFAESADASLSKREEIAADEETESTQPSKANSNVAIPTKKLLPRTAVVIRTWDEFEYREEDILHLRAMISELSLGSGGEYDVHLLVQVKNEAAHPVWADEETYQNHLRESVPEEFHGIATLWSETQMLMLYQGIYDTFARGPDLPVHGSYRGLQMAMQHFAHKHPEYDFFWHWEMDIRYTGHYYNLFSQIDDWTKTQPRKGLWERNSRFYIPSVHGSWEDFKQMTRVQTEMGTDSPNNMWSGLNGAKSGSEIPKVDKSIWGPERPKEPEDWFEIEGDPVPPTTFEKDKYVWGVGEDADLVTFNPIFNPDGTTWLLTKDITGYNVTESLPPRRAAIVTSSRMSRRLLTTMHRETAFQKHHAFSEMWPATTALHHGYKAVYVPHPMYVDREWPTEYLASVMNGGRNGASGGARTSVFGEREHNLLGMTWYYNAGFAPNLWKRWLGLKVNNDGGEDFEMTVDDEKNGEGVDGMKGGEGRMCLPPMLIHPIKGVELPVEGIPEDEVPESDPSA